MGTPATLPANFSGFDEDKTQSSSTANTPQSLPADFNGFDEDKQSSPAANQNTPDFSSGKFAQHLVAPPEAQPYSMPGGRMIDPMTHSGGIPNPHAVLPTATVTAAPSPSWIDRAKNYVADSQFGKNLHTLGQEAYGFLGGGAADQPADTPSSPGYTDPDRYVQQSSGENSPYKPIAGAKQIWQGTGNIATGAGFGGKSAMQLLNENPSLTPEEAVAESARQNSAGRSLSTVAKGATQVMGGGMEIAKPMIVYGVAAAPIKAAIYYGAGILAGKGSAQVAQELGATPDEVQFFNTAGFFIPSVLTGLAGLKTASIPEGAKVIDPVTGENVPVRGGVAGGRGFAAGVARSDTGGYAGQVRVGPYSVGVKFGRNAPEAPGGPVQPQFEPGGPQGPAEPQSATAIQQRAQAATVAETAASAAAINLKAAQIVGMAPPPPPPPKPGEPGSKQAPPPAGIEQGHISQQVMSDLGSAITQLPPDVQPKAVLAATGKLAEVMFDAKTIIGPDGKVVNVDSQKAAQTEAVNLVNDQVEQHQKAAQDAAKAKDEALQKQQEDAETAAQEREIARKEAEKNQPPPPIPDNPVTQAIHASLAKLPVTTPKADVIFAVRKAGAAVGRLIPEKLATQFYDEFNAKAAQQEDAASAGVTGEQVNHDQNPIALGRMANDVQQGKTAFLHVQPTTKFKPTGLTKETGFISTKVDKATDPTFNGQYFHPAEIKSKDVKLAASGEAPLAHLRGLEAGRKTGKTVPETKPAIPETKAAEPETKPTGPVEKPSADDEAQIYREAKAAALARGVDPNTTEEWGTAIAEEEARILAERKGESPAVETKAPIPTVQEAIAQSRPIGGVKPEPAKPKEAAAPLSTMDRFKKAQQAKSDKFLDGPRRASDGAVVTPRQKMDQRLADGWKVEVEDVKDDAAIARIKREMEQMMRGHNGWGPPANENHPDRIKYNALKKELADGPKTKEYSISDGKGDERIISKTEYDYAKSKEVAQSPAKQNEPVAPKVEEKPKPEQKVVQSAVQEPAARGKFAEQAAQQIAGRLRKVADGMQAAIDNGRRPMTQNPTPKRMAEYRTRVIDADEMERTQKAFRALADAHEAGTVPKELAALRTKDEIGRLVRKGLDTSGGYYSRVPRQDYADKSPAGKALQGLIEGKASPEKTAAQAEQAKLAKIKQLEAEVQFAKVPGSFPTPKPLAERLVREADIKPGMSVLEPSAGKGNIADAIKANTPDAKIDTVERQPKLAEILNLKGYNVAGSDFLEHSGQYDRIVMNPPFENGQDIEHLQRAYDMLKPGGRVVAITSESPFFRTDKKYAAFRDWLEEHNGTSEKLDAGSFTGKDSERQTGVATRMVVIDKPTQKPAEVAQPEKPTGTALNTYEAEVSKYAGDPHPKMVQIQAENRRHAEQLLAEKHPGMRISSAGRVDTAPKYLKRFDLGNGTEARMYQMNDGRYAVAVWDTDADKSVSIVSYPTEEQATKAFEKGTSQSVTFKPGQQVSVKHSDGTQKPDQVRFMSPGGKVVLKGQRKPVKVEDVSPAETEIAEHRAAHKPGTFAQLVIDHGKAADKLTALMKDPNATPAGLAEAAAKVDELAPAMEQESPGGGPIYAEDFGYKKPSDPVVNTKPVATMEDAAKGSATPEYLSGGIGAVLSPELLTKALESAPAPVRELVAKAQDEYANVRKSRSLQSSLYDLDSAANADVIRAKRFMESVPGDANDYEAVYHHIEDPKLPLTDLQQKILDDYIRPLMASTTETIAEMRAVGAETDNTYVHRIVMDRGGFIDRLLAGSKSTGKGNVLKTKVPSQKSRTMMAVEDKDGERNVVSIKGNRVTAFVDGQPVDLGGLRNGLGTKLEEISPRLDPIAKNILDTKAEIDGTHEAERQRQIENIEKQIERRQRDAGILSSVKGRVPGQYAAHGVEPSFGKRAALSREIEALEKQLDALKADTAPISAHETAALKRLNKRLAGLEADREAILDSVPTEHLADEIWKDKTGKEWKITQATTKEIEDQTDLQYYHNALGSAIINWLAVEKQARAVRFLDALKSSPDFPTIAVPIAETNGAPEGWKTTQLAQMRSYYFEPHTAEVLDWYNDRLKAGDPGAFSHMNDFLVSSIFFNPLLHVPNIANHWFVEKGLSGWLDPRNKVSQFKAGLKAIDAVMHQNDDFLKALDAGGALKSQQFEARKFAETFLDKMQKELEGNPTALQKVANALGYANPLKWLEALKNVSSHVTWYSNDIAFLQSAYEKTAHGMDLATALQETAKHIPDYRMPTRIFDSKGLEQFLNNKNLVMFMNYHYGAIKSYGETIKSLLGIDTLGKGMGNDEPSGTDYSYENAKGEPVNAAGRTRDQERMHGLDILAALGLVTFILYPLMDQFLKHATGNKDAQIRRAGASTVPYNLIQVAHGEKSPWDAIQSSVTPGVTAKLALEAAMNRDLRTGKQIYSWPPVDTKTFATQAGERLVASFGPAAAVQGAHNFGAAKQLWGMAGVSFPQHGGERIATEIAQAKAGSEALTPDARKRMQAHYAALDALRAGDGKTAREKMDEEGLNAKQQYALRKEADADPLLARVKTFTLDELKTVYQYSTPEEKMRLGPFMRDKEEKEHRKEIGLRIKTAQ